MPIYSSFPIIAHLFHISPTTSTMDQDTKLRLAGFKTGRLRSIEASKHFFFSAVDIVSCIPGKVTAKTGLPYKDVVALRRRLLHEHACVPVAASNLWETTNQALLPTGNLDYSVQFLVN